MIVTVTPNPSLDRTMLIDTWTRGGIHRPTSVRLTPGGKGVNVARAVAAADQRVIAVMPSGGPEGARLAELLAPEAVAVVEVPIARATRSNVIIQAADGTTTQFNEPGPELTDEELTALEARAAELAGRARWVVSCGSLPDGCPDTLHARLVDRCHQAGTRAAVDASGPALARACRAGPDLITPNLAELADLTDRRLDHLGEVVDAADGVRRAGVAAVLVSLGQHGALLVQASAAWHATSPVTPVSSAVGAGDALLAGFLIAGGDGISALRTAVAYGAAAAGLSGGRVPTPRDLRPDEVSVCEANESLRLTEAAV